MSISRRKFVMGCSTAIAAMAGARIGQMVFASEAEQTFTNYLPLLSRPDEIFVMVFLRGGMDGLSLMAPYNDARYVSARGNLALPSPGPGKTNAAITLTPNNPTYDTSNFGLHASAAPLKELYDAGKLALIHACGLNDDTRSHFDAMDYIERGTPGDKNTSTGWLTRHIGAVGSAQGLLPTIAAGSAAPSSLLSYPEGVVMNDINSYGLSGPYGYNNASNPAMFNTLKKFYTGAGAFQEAGKRAVEVVDAIQSLKTANGGKDLTYTPESGVTYPNGGLTNSLKLLAQIIKLNMGLQIATVDFGGWDTHDNQGTNGGYFASQVDTLSRALHAFYNDLPNHRNRLTVVVMSEFGRRLGKNAGDGTDHGHGGMMMVMGGQINGGKIYGRWPGLEDLDQNQDLRITTDYRSVLGEVLAQRLGNTKIGTVFPGFTQAEYQRLGIVPGADLPLDFAAP